MGALYLVPAAVAAVAAVVLVFVVVLLRLWLRRWLWFRLLRRIGRRGSDRRLRAVVPGFGLHRTDDVIVLYRHRAAALARHRVAHAAPLHALGHLEARRRPAVEVRQHRVAHGAEGD